jgi:hypothetical protein
VTNRTLKERTHKERTLKERTLKERTLKERTLEGRTLEERTLEEWIALYEKSTGREWEPLPHEWVSWTPERGVMTFIDPAYSEPGTFEGHIIIGDGKYWLGLIKEFMTQNGLTKATFFTRRNPVPIQRRFGFHIRGYVMEANIDELKV